MARTKAFKWTPLVTDAGTKFPGTEELIKSEDSTERTLKRPMGHQQPLSFGTFMPSLTE